MTFEILKLARSGPSVDFKIFEELVDEVTVTYLRLRNFANDVVQIGECRHLIHGVVLEVPLFLDVWDLVHHRLKLFDAKLLSRFICRLKLLELLRWRPDDTLSFRQCKLWW